MMGNRAYARIGLMGNPSDGFYGKTISACIRNFYAQVVLMEGKRIKIIPHSLHDPTEFSNLEELEETANRDGYYGGIRLIYATCKRFAEYCRETGITLDDRKFSIIYDTNIPRQVGLGGSSAIIVSLLKALMEFYELTNDDIPLELQPGLVLSVETKELGISAGLQDRVIQTYGGVVYMDFNKQTLDTLGHGIYEPMDPGLLPNLFVAYVDGSGKDSGKMHNEVRFRFNQGDTEIINAMAEFASYAMEAKCALEAHDHKRFGELMNMNFSLRRKIYGDSVLGEANLRMIKIAHEFGVPAKFPGSGGAIIGMYKDEEQCARLRQAYLVQGFHFVKVMPDI